jgi:hypothetical protein
MEYGDNMVVIWILSGLLLFVFGLWFDAYVSRHQDDAPVYVSLWVAFGCAVTLAVSFLVEITCPLNLPGTVIAAAGFVLSGVPMMWGSFKRLNARRQDEAETERERARLMKERHDAAR